MSVSKFIFLSTNSTQKPSIEFFTFLPHLFRTKKRSESRFALNKGPVMKITGYNRPFKFKSGLSLRQFRPRAAASNSLLEAFFTALLRPRMIKACQKCRSKSKSYFDFQCFCKKRKVVEIFCLITRSDLMLTPNWGFGAFFWQGEWKQFQFSNIDFRGRSWIGSELTLIRQWARRTSGRAFVGKFTTGQFKAKRGP